MGVVVGIVVVLIVVAIVAYAVRSVMRARGTTSLMISGANQDEVVTAIEESGVLRQGRWHPGPGKGAVNTRWKPKLLDPGTNDTVVSVIIEPTPDGLRVDVAETEGTRVNGAIQNAAGIAAQKSAIAKMLTSRFDAVAIPKK